MCKFIAGLWLIAIGLMLLEQYSFRFTNDAVLRRYQSGDYTCGVKKTWWGWRVREYGEDRL
jgi:hypothetical protein